MGLVCFTILLFATIFGMIQGTLIYWREIRYILYQIQYTQKMYLTVPLSLKMYPYLIDYHLDLDQNICVTR